MKSSRKLLFNELPGDLVGVDYHLFQLELAISLE